MCYVLNGITKLEDIDVIMNLALLDTGNTERRWRN